MRFWNTFKICSRDPKRACEPCHWKRKTHQHWKLCAGDLSETNEMSINMPKVQLKGILLDFGYIHEHFIWFHLDIPKKIRNIPKRFITILKVPKRSSSSCRNQVRVELIPSSLWCCLLMSDHHHKKKNPPCCIVWISLLDMCHIVVVSAHISVVTNQCTSHWKKQVSSSKRSMSRKNWCISPQPGSLHPKVKGGTIHRSILVLRPSNEWPLRVIQGMDGMMPNESECLNFRNKCCTCFSTQLRHSC